MNNQIILTTKDYDNISWHDNIIHTISMVDENWENDLILGIDYITQWICDGNTCKFMIAPANLIFHNVESFELCIQKPGLMMHSYLNLIINDIKKEPSSTNGKELWTFDFCKTGEETNNKLSFLSSGFTQTLLKAPVLKDEQHLFLSER